MNGGKLQLLTVILGRRRRAKEIAKVTIKADLHKFLTFLCSILSKGIIESFNFSLDLDASLIDIEAITFLQEIVANLSHHMLVYRIR